jgi:hypothetical protein
MRKLHLSAKMAQRLGRYFGTGAEYWGELQLRHEGPSAIAFNYSSSPLKNREVWGSWALVLRLAVAIEISGSAWRGFLGAVTECA